MNPVSIEQMIGMSFPKYVTLNDANESLAHTKAEHVNIYIDAYQVLSAIYNSQVTISSTEIGIVSGLVNLCIHLRSYYRTVFSVESTIYIIYTDGLFLNNAKYFPEYNRSNITKRYGFKNTATVVENNIKLLDLLCKYLPDIYMVRTELEPAVAIYELISSDKNNKDPNIVFSKDPHMYLLLATYIENTVIFRLTKRYTSETIRTIFPPDCLIEYVRSTRKEIGTDTMGRLKLINSSNLALVLALIGDKTRSIPYTKNLDVAVRVLLDMINQNKMLNTYTGDIYEIYDNFPSNIKAKIDRTSFGNRWKALDVYFQHGIYFKTHTPLRAGSWNTNLYDPEAVKDINNKYFLTNPIDLNRI